MDLMDRLNWRYACKKMDPSKKVAEETVDRIVEAARLAPTSSGLQPFEVLVITNRPLREKIQAIAWNQGMVTDSSHLLVFAAWDDYTPERINMMFDLTNAISKLNLNIASAHVTTFGERAVDAFYVTDLTGAKIVSPQRQIAIKRQLLDVFEIRSLNPSKRQETTPAA
mgnify:CR=1 FL=1